MSGSETLSLLKQPPLSLFLFFEDSEKLLNNLATALLMSMFTSSRVVVPANGEERKQEELINTAWHLLHMCSVADFLIFWALPKSKSQLLSRRRQEQELHH